MEASTVLRLIGISTILVVSGICLYLLLYKSKKVSQLNKWIKSLIVGACFGALAIGSFYCGVKIDYVDNANIGCANIALLIAAFVFDIPSSIIAGIIAFFYRMFMNPFTVSDLLRYPSAISLFLTILLSFLIKKFLCKNKSPRWYSGFLIGILIEDLNTLLILLFFLDRLSDGYNIISQVDIELILTSGLFLGLILFFKQLIDKEKLFFNFKSKDIANKIKRNLTIGCAISFLLSTGITVIVNISKSNEEARIEIKQNLDAIELDMQDEYLNYSFFTLATHNYVGNTGFSMIINVNEGGPDIPNSHVDYEASFDEKGIIKYDIKYYKAYEIVSISDNVSHGILGSIFPYDILEGKRDNALYALNLNNINFIAMIRHLPDLKGNPFIVISGFTSQEALSNTGVSLRLALHTEALVLVTLFFVISSFIDRKIIKNVKKINTSLEKITYGDLNEEVKVNGISEFESIAEDINLTVGALKNYAGEVERRIERDLKLARDIQASSLSKLFPINENYNLYAKMQTAKDVGGDFYEFFKVGEDLIFFMIADVSGKGIPASLFMMRAKTLVKPLSTSDITLEQLVTNMNDDLCSGNEMGLFVTAWFGLLNVTNGELVYVNAGHNPPILKQNNEYKQFVTPSGLVLAAMEGMKYKQRKIKLSPHDIIVLYTDGVTEAIDKDKNLYSTERLVNLLNNNKTLLNAKEITNCIFDDVNAYQKNLEQFDDITVLTLSFDKFRK